MMTIFNTNDPGAISAYTAQVESSLAGGEAVGYKLQQVQAGIAPIFVNTRAEVVAEVSKWTPGTYGVQIRVEPTGAAFVPFENIPWMSLEEAVVKFSAVPLVPAA